MRKSKVLSTFIGLSSVVACAAPLTFATSCNKTKKWASYNFVELLYAGEYAPEVKPLENSSGVLSDDQIIELYLSKIKDNPQIFKDDFCYTVNSIRNDSLINSIYGEGKEGIYKVQANVGKVEVDVSKHEINFTLGFYMAGSILGTQQQRESGENCYKNINIYSEVRRNKPFRIEGITRDPANYKTEENVLVLTSTETEKEGDFLYAPYTLTLVGTFWYYNDIGELKKFSDMNLQNKEMNTSETFSKDDLAYSQIANTYTFWMSRYLLRNDSNITNNQMPIASKYLTKFKTPNNK